MITSITLLSGRRIFWHLGLLLATAGILIGCFGLDGALKRSRLRDRAHRIESGGEVSAHLGLLHRMVHQ